MRHTPYRMRFIPTYCDACSSSTLSMETSISAGHCQCSGCGGEARTVPGLSYGDADRTVYDALAHALREAGLAPLNAEQLLAQIDAQILKNSPGLTLRYVSRSLPALGQLELLVSEEGYALRKAESMLVTLLAAHATGHRQSGVMPAVGWSARVKQAVGR